jgi:ABC-2 type transport system permease protein
MSTTLAIFKREFKGYFASPIAYIYLTAFIVLINWLYMRGFFLINQASLRSLFSILPWIFLLFVPAVTMRLWAEERKLGTLEILMTLPVKDVEVVMGKFLASYAFLSLSILLTLPIPLTLTILGNPDGGQIIGGYLGTILLGGAYLAIGLFASSLTENQIIAFIIGILLCFVLFIIGEQLVLFALPSFFVPIFEYLGLGSHFNSIGRGVLDSRDLIYYISIIGFFLFLNVRALESKR